MSMKIARNQMQCKAMTLVISSKLINDRQTLSLRRWRKREQEKKKRGEGCELPEENNCYPRKTRATEDQNQAQLSILFSTMDGRLTRR